MKVIWVQRMIVVIKNNKYGHYCFEFENASSFQQNLKNFYLNSLDNDE
jgi:hypothetical protein